MITLSTTVYEKNFRMVLDKHSWFFSFKNGLITKKKIIVNNIINKSEFLEKIKDFDDVEFVYSGQYLNEVNQFFHLNTNSFDRSYYYSIQHYTDILSEKFNDYIFSVGADCKIHQENIEDFFQNSMTILQYDSDVISTTIPWCEPDSFKGSGEYEQNYHRISKRHNRFYFSKVFSDQVYLIKVDKMKKINFRHTIPLHPFPLYGGNTFEKRLTNFLIINNFYRAIYKTKDYYQHKSF